MEYLVPPADLRTDGGGLRELRGRVSGDAAGWLDVVDDLVPVVQQREEIGK